MSTKMPALRELLSQKPSQRLWNELVTLFQEWPEDPERQVAMEYTAQHLKSWDPWLRQATPTNLTSLWPLVHLFSLQNGSLTRKSRSLLTLSSHIRALKIRGHHFKKAKQDLKELSHITEYSLWSISRWKDLEELRDMTHIRRLNLFSPHSLRSLKGLEALQSLEHLTISDAGTLQHVEELGELPRLKTVHLSGFNAFRTMTFPPMPQVESLSLIYLERLQRLEGLEDMTSLQRLEFASCFTLTEGVEKLTSLEKLSSLRISGCTTLSVQPENERMTRREEVMSYLEELVAFD